MNVEIGINDGDRKKIGEGLARLLADSYTLYLKTHGYHWNVTGPMFPVLHEQFEEQYKDLQAAVDEIAERVRMLGEFAPGSYKEFGRLTTLRESDGVPAARDMITDLMHDHETLARKCRELVAVAEKAGDAGTVDLLSQRLRKHEKAAWMLRCQTEQPTRKETVAA